MDLEIWLSDEDYQRKVEYLVYSYKRLDAELFSSFDYVPLREENLNVSSMFFADICLRVFPNLLIGFNALTFGNKMKNRLLAWKTQKERGDHPNYFKNIEIDDILREIKKIKCKNLENKDGIWDYYNFYKRSNIGIHNYFNLNKTVEPLYHLGRIEYDKRIQPFEGKTFETYIKTRNAIEHRGMVEASLKEAYSAVSALYLVIEHFTEMLPKRLSDLLIFGDPYLSRPDYSF
jgi:hypothetical protein